jgi:hypothetical protein
LRFFSLISAFKDSLALLNVAKIRFSRAGEDFHGCFLRLGNFLLQNCAVQRNAARIRLLRARPEEQTAQHHENQRKNSLLN